MSSLVGTYGYNCAEADAGKLSWESMTIPFNSDVTEEYMKQYIYYFLSHGLIVQIVPDLDYPCIEVTNPYPLPESDEESIE